MWRIVWFFLGLTQLSIEGASPEQVLRRYALARIAFRDCSKPEPFTLRLWVLRRDEARAQQLAAGCGCECRVLARGGFGQVFGGLRRRPVLLGLLATAVAAGIVVPKFVFFYTVEGNETVPTAQILRELDALGVGFGTYGPSIKPQTLKNQMLLRIPRLQWLTVQQSGMCARVVVRERLETEPVLDRRTPTNVVAARAGVITRVQAEAGSCLCAPGQAVTAGQLLVSAYTDFGYKVQLSAARAEVYARTLRTAVCVVPQTQQVKSAPTRTRTALSLLVGRRRIALFGEGETAQHCDRTEIRRFLTLPGGFSLPLGIAITRISEYDTREQALQADAVRQQLTRLVQADAQRQMVAGTIVGSRERVSEQDGCVRLEASLQCEEMIARMQPANLKEAIP